MDAEAAGGIVVGTGCCLFLVVLPLLIPFLLGHHRRRLTLDDLAAREPRVEHLIRTSTTASARDHTGTTTLVHGNAAYAADFPSRIALTFRRVAGGAATSLTEQAEMARRLASVRMLEEAAALGAVGVVNIRQEASHMEMNSSRSSALVEMLAYGTALVPAPGRTEVTTDSAEGTSGPDDPLTRGRP